MSFELCGVVTYYETTPSSTICDSEWRPPIQRRVFNIDITSVDRERERLCVSLSYEEAEIFVVFALATTDDDRTVLMLDHNRTSAVFKEEVCDLLRDELGIDDLAGFNVRLVTPNRADNTWMSVHYPFFLEISNDDFEVVIEYVCGLPDTVPEFSNLDIVKRLEVV